MPRDVLVIDDEPKVRRALRSLFEDRGCRVTAVGSAHELQQLREPAADVLLLDLKLGDASGLELLPRLRQRFPRSRLIVISALSDEPTIRQAMLSGADDYMVKPFDFARCFSTAMGLPALDAPTAASLPPAMAGADAARALRARA
ncbi:MAG: response regulator, partial [Dehalococcoidia bacterium]|nr:response regulator [Dehalococcoidia bacterium]